MNYSIDKVDIDKIDLCMPPNKILGPAVEAGAGAEDRNDLPVWHPAPPYIAHCAHHAVLHQMSQMKNYPKIHIRKVLLQVNVVFYVYLPYSSPPLLALCNM